MSEEAADSGALEGSSSTSPAVNNNNNNINKCITTIAINRAGSVVFVGTKAGDVHLLDVATFKVRDNGGLISQSALLKSDSGVPADLKKPGSVEAVEECPTQRGKLLIGYNRSLIALWDYEQQTLVKHFIIEQVRFVLLFVDIFCNITFYVAIGITELA